MSVQGQPAHWPSVSGQALSRVSPYMMPEINPAIHEPSDPADQAAPMNDVSGFYHFLIRSGFFDYAALAPDTKLPKGFPSGIKLDFKVDPLPTVRPTQADNLPPYVWKHIPNVRPLSAKFKSIYWLHVVQGHLANLGIKDVIDKLIDRPDESHPKYNDWVRWSQRVDRWLFSNVGEKIKNRLQKAVPPLEYADMTMEQILLLEPNADDRMNIEALDLWNMHRTNYATAFEYVEAWNDQVQHCRRLDIGIGYYLATKIMMQELSIEYPVVTAFVHNEMREQDKAAHKMDEKSFAVVVDGMRGVALRREYPFVASTAPATE